MSICVWSGVKSFVACVTFALLAGCGGGGGGPAQVPPDTALPLMFDSLGRQVPEADFGSGDPAAAGADGIAFDGGPIANAQVTLSDNGGSIRTTTTDASGYYRVDIKNLQLPFIVKVKRADGTEWWSAGVNSAVSRGFVTIHVNGLTDKAVGYVAESLSLSGGAASAITPSLLAINHRLLDPAKARLRAGLAVPLINAGLDPASFDPVTAPLLFAAGDMQAAFLSGLTIGKTAHGRTFVAATLAGAGGAIGTGPGAPVKLGPRQGLAMDVSGNLYVAGEHSVSKVTPGGVVSRLAGADVPGFVDGAGNVARFLVPTAVAVDAGGNVYVADSGNHAVRRISAGGVVTTLAGGGFGFADGTGAAARFTLVTGIAVDGAGNVYVQDELNNSVRKISAAGVVTTVAGRFPDGTVSGACCLASPGSYWQTWVAVDVVGNLYSAPLVDQNRVIRKITPAGVQTDVYAPVGDEARAFNPFAIAVDADGTVYATDYYTNRIHRVSPAGTATTLAGGAVQSAGIAVGGGNLFVASGGTAIRKITAAGEVSTFAGRTGGFADGAGKNVRFERPTSVAVDAAGNVLVADMGNDAIRRISATGAVTTFAGGVTGGLADGSGAAARFNAPSGIALDSSGNAYVADSGNNAIRKISPSGVVSTLAGGVTAGFADGTARAARFNSPSGVAVDREGNVYVSDVGNASIRKVTPAGVVSTVAGTGRVTGIEQLKTQDFDGVRAIAVEPNGTVSFGASCLNGIYTRFHPCLRNVMSDGKSSRREQPFSFAIRSGLAFDSQSALYSTVAFDRKILKLTPAGVETEVAMVTRFNQLEGIAVDLNGNLVVADSGRSVWEFRTDPVQPDPAIWIVLP